MRAGRWPRTGKRKLFLRMVLVAAVVLGFAALTASGFALRLAQGPVAVPAVGAQIRAALQQRFGERFTFGLGEAVVEWSSGGPALSVANLRIADTASQQTVLAAPRLTLGLDTLALLSGRMRPTRFELHDLELRLDVQPDGQMAIAAGPGETGAVSLDLAHPGFPRPMAEPDAPERPVGMLESMASLVRLILDAALDPDHPISSVESIALLRGRLVVTDRHAGQTTTFKGVEIDFTRSARRGAQLRLAADGPSGRWSMVAQARGKSHGERELDIEVKDISLDEIALAAGLRQRPVEMSMPLSARMSFSLAADQSVTAAQGRFGFGAGFLRIDDPAHKPLHVDEFIGGFRWDPTERRIIVEQTQFYAGETQISLGGLVTPPNTQSPLWQIVLASRDNQLASDKPEQGPLALDSLQVAARFDSMAKVLFLDRMDIAGPSVGAIVTGRFDAGESGPAMQLSVDARRMPTQSFMTLWPTLVSGETRGWLLHNLKGGILESGRLQVDLDAATFAKMRAQEALPVEAVTMDFSLLDASLTYLDGAPPIERIAGRGHVDGRSVTLKVSEGVIGPPERPMRLTEGAFTVADHSLHPAPAQVAARITGPVHTLAEMLAREPLRSYADLPVDPATLKGQFDGRLTIDLELGDKARADQTKVRVQATAAQVSAENFLGGETLDGASFTIAADERELLVKGEGRVAGAPAQIELRKGGEKPGEASVNLTLDDAQRAKRGLNPAAGLNGPVMARFVTPLESAPGPRAGAKVLPRTQVELDFTKATIDDLIPGLSKPAGRNAKAGFVLVQNGEGYQLEQLTFEGGGMSFKGQAQLDAGGGFQSAKITQMRLSPSDDFTLEASKAGDAVKLVVRGNAVDARPFLKNLFAGGEPRRDKADSKGPNFDLDLKSALVTGHNKRSLSGVDLKFSRRDGAIRTLSLTGRFGRDPLSISLNGRNAVGALVDVEGRDAGAALAFLDLYKRMEGGALSGTFQAGAERLDGVLAIRGFVLRDEPAMRRLVAETASAGFSVSGAEPRRRADGGVVPFDRFEAQFEKRGGRIALRDAVLAGPTIGATLEGSLDFDRDRVALSGTFVPAYSVNNFFSKIPLFGPLLGGGANEGLVGVNFKIAGPASGPVLTVNPLSAITPGFLRKIFSVVDGTGVGRTSRHAAPPAAGGSPAAENPTAEHRAPVQLPGGMMR